MRSELSEEGRKALVVSTKLVEITRMTRTDGGGRRAKRETTNSSGVVQDLAWYEGESYLEGAIVDVRTNPSLLLICLITESQVF